MKAELIFKSPGERDSVREGVRLFLTGAGYQQPPGEDLTFTRGSPLRRILSLRVEDWPTRLSILLVEVAPDETGVVCRYDVRSGFHLVGTVDRAVLESEAALLEEYLATGRRGSLEESVAAVRRPVHVAAVLNMILAVLIVVWVGRVAGYPLHWVGLAALLVAFLDGLVILSFADLVLDGARRLPRLRDRDPTPPRASLPTQRTADPTPDAHA